MRLSFGPRRVRCTEDAANVLVIGSYAIETFYREIVDGERVGWMK